MARDPIIAIVLSAVVAPGAGQFRQKRPVVGSLFLILFLAGFAWFCYLLFPSLIHNIRYIIRAGVEEPVAVPFGQIALTLGGLVLVYALNVLDVWLYGRS